MKRAALLAALVLLLASARADAAPPIPIDGIAAVVDDVVLFRSDIATRMKTSESQLPKDPTKRAAALAELYYVTVRRMVDETLVAKDAERLHIEVTDAEVARGIDVVATENKITRAQLEAEVLKVGMTVAAYEADVRRQIVQGKWMVSRAVGKLDRKQASDPAAFDAALEKFRAKMLAELKKQAFVEIR